MPDRAARREDQHSRGVASMKLALTGTVVFIFACILVPQGLLEASPYSDVNVYSRYAHAMVHGQIPYRDFFDEYPPLAQPLLLAAARVVLFKLVLVACGVGTVWLLALVFRSAYCVAVFAASPLLVGSIYLNAYDLWPALLLTIALALFVRSRPMWGFAVLGAATAAKIYPAAVLPVAVLLVPRASRSQGLSCFLGVFVGLHLPFLVLGPGGLRFSYTLQIKRGLEMNSLGASILLATHRHMLVKEAPGSLDLAGGEARTVAAVSIVLIVLGIAAATWLYRSGRLSFVSASAGAVASFVAFGKVFSAQYVEWLAPVAPLAGAIAAALTVVVLALTHAVFSHRTALSQQRELGWLVARNASVVTLALCLLTQANGRARHQRARLRRHVQRRIASIRPGAASQCRDRRRRSVA